jgi:hypothetical protein
LWKASVFRIGLSMGSRILTISAFLLTAMCIVSYYFFDSNKPEEKKEQDYTYKPASLGYIDSLEYDQIRVIQTDDTVNKFTSAFELTPHRKHIDSLMNTCYQYKSNSKRWPECYNLIKRLTWSQIGPVLKMQILRFDSTSNKKIILYRDGTLDSEEAGYWIAISNKTGVWNLYYTGLTEAMFYYIKSRSTLKFIVNDSTLQVEAAQVRQTKPHVHPVRHGEVELLKDGLILKINLNKITHDADADGLTDILEKKLVTNPSNADTDGDGTYDFEDLNPRYKSKFNKYTALYNYLINGTRRDSIFIPFTTPASVSASVGKQEIETTYLLVTDDENMLYICPETERHIIMTTSEYKIYKKNNPSMPVHFRVSALEKIQGKDDTYKVHIGGAISSRDFIIIETATGWKIKFGGESIV